jgi:light-regulated signal transduction histidine kinase (bacteriophytochrome)
MVALYGQLFQRRHSGNLDEEAAQALGFMITGAQRMEMLLRDLLVYSQTGSDQEAPGPVDCQDILASVTQNLQLSIEQNKATVTWGPLPEIRAHEIRIVQLFQNLIGNALKFRGSEPPKVHVAARREGREWIFSVRDNGIGIDPAEAEAVFAIFKRLRTEIPGTGVGLAICKKIVERHGGRIWVESEPGRGSTFFFTIPAS